MTAEEMFIGLGMIKTTDDEKYLIYSDLYDEDLYIIFYKEYKAIGGVSYYDYFCDFKLLQVINQQCKELGWLE